MILQGLRWPALSRIVSSRYWLELDFAGHDTMQRVRVSWTQCYLGGWRPWMHCPHCEKRVAKLLKGLGGYYCRACIGNPLYASQTKSAHGRRHFEICKIRLQLNGMASPIEPFPDRPRGMHRKRYDRLKARALNLEMDLPPKLRGKTSITAIWSITCRDRFSIDLGKRLQCGTAARKRRAERGHSLSSFQVRVAYSVFQLNKFRKALCANFYRS